MAAGAIEKGRPAPIPERAGRGDSQLERLAKSRSFGSFWTIFM